MEFQIGDILIRENAYYLVVDKKNDNYTIMNFENGNKYALSILIDVRRGYYQKVS